MVPWFLLTLLGKLYHLIVTEKNDNWEIVNPKEWYQCALVTWAHPLFSKFEDVVDQFLKRREEMRYGSASFSRNHLADRHSVDRVLKDVPINLLTTVSQMPGTSPCFIYRCVSQTVQMPVGNFFFEQITWSIKMSCSSTTRNQCDFFVCLFKWVPDRDPEQRVKFDCTLSADYYSIN